MTVYSNEIVPVTSYYEPGYNGPGFTMAEDLELAGGACAELVYYNLAVYGVFFPYDVHTELWDDNPCEPGASVIAGTEADFPGLANDEMFLLEAFLDASPVEVPDTVWLAATFSTQYSGWVVAEEAEIGFTDDLWSQGSAFPCLKWWEGNPYAGFWATVNCNVEDPTGACCEGTTCTEVTEAECTNGTWQGEFTTCDPNPCLPGACCTGSDLTTCTDTTEAGCADLPGLFHPQSTCAESPCQPGFLVYRNDHEANGVFTISNGTLAADDQTMGPGTPCDLSSFELDVFGLPGSGSYDVTVELWSNDEGPDAPITGTTTIFSNLRDSNIHRLIAGPFEGITLPDIVWMVVSTSTDDSGWFLGGPALIGSTADVFAIYNDPTHPGDWSGFDFQDPAIWSGFRANVWCHGTAPKGACCNDAAGTCFDGVTLFQCEGRWVVDATCDSNPFNPPCGTNACCALYGCGDKLTSECLDTEGVPAFGSFCADEGFECPRNECLSASGDCYADNGTPGCEDPFCCEAVCSGDPFCCTDKWDEGCAEDAQSFCQPLPPDNDHCANAEPIAGEGEFSFDNTMATMDGPPHEGCIDPGDEEPDGRITRDVWYQWTSPCTDAIYVRTCDHTTVDTKVAAYSDTTTCPPTDASLLDCNDDACGFTEEDLQSQITFDATTDQSFLIRIGTSPGADGGSGMFAVSCGPPEVPACPGTGDCCTDTGSPGCSDQLCCQLVCLCDAYCCEVEWDESCSKMGVDNNGCGAQLMCPDLCGAGSCPEEPVTFLEPPDGVIDARQPYPPTNASERQGIDKIIVEGPPKIDNITCWKLCETAEDGSRNRVTEVVDNENGTFTVKLLRSISTGAVTTVTYTTGSGTPYTHTSTSHPANVNADNASNATDIPAMMNILNGGAVALWGHHSTDVDHSGVVAPADVLRVIDLLNGADEFEPWLGTDLPECGVCCP